MSSSIIESAQRSAQKASLSGLGGLLNENDESTADYHIFPKWLSKHLPELGISNAAKKYLYNTFQVSSAASLATVINLLVAGTLAGVFWYITAGILALIVLHTIIKHIIIPSFRYLTRSIKSRKLLNSIKQELKLKGVNTKQFKLHSKEKAALFAAGQRTITTAIDKACEHLGIDPSNPPQQSKPAVLLDSELQALKEYLDDDVNHELKAAFAPSSLEDTSTLQQWPPSEVLKNISLIKIPENGSPVLTQALMKLNRTILSNHCAEACLYSSNPVTTAQSVLVSTIHDFIRKHKDPQAIHDALQLQGILSAEPNTQRFNSLCNVLKINNDESSERSIFFLLNQISTSSRFTQRGLLANGRMLHSAGDTSPCATRINRVTLDFSLAECLAISTSSITQHLQSLMISSPKMTPPGPPDMALQAQAPRPSPQQTPAPKDSMGLKLRKKPE